MSASPRFVILTHDYPVLHWDLMLEVGDALRTWRLACEPQYGIPIPAAELADHRRLYLDYEGPVSGGRGTVVRWETGTLSAFDESSGAVIAVVEGKRIQGTVTLSRTQDREGWVAVFHPADSAMR